ncbi:unnamed protein product [Gordionus sp. m RMFG-2023]
MKFWFSKTKQNRYPSKSIHKPNITAKKDNDKNVTMAHVISVIRDPKEKEVKQIIIEENIKPRKLSSIDKSNLAKYLDEKLRNTYNSDVNVETWGQNWDHLSQYPTQLLGTMNKLFMRKYKRPYDKSRYPWDQELIDPYFNDYGQLFKYLCQIDPTILNNMDSAENKDKVLDSIGKNCDLKKESPYATCRDYLGIAPGSKKMCAPVFFIPNHNLKRCHQIKSECSVSYPKTSYYL